MFFSILLSVPVYFAASTATYNLIAVLVGPISPLILNLPDAPPCTSFLALSGVADNDADIYVNDNYTTRSTVLNGAFLFNANLPNISNVFVLKSKKGAIFSPTSTYTINKNPFCYDGTSLVTVNGPGEGSLTSGDVFLQTPIYRYVEGIGQASLQGSTQIHMVTFMVERSWLTANAVPDFNVVLSARPIVGQWLDMPTVITGQDASAVYYRSTVPGPGVFAITTRPRPPALNLPALICDPTEVSFTLQAEKGAEFYMGDEMLGAVGGDGVYEPVFEFGGGTTAFNFKTKRGDQFSDAAAITINKDPMCFKGEQMILATGQEMPVVRFWSRVTAGTDINIDVGYNRTYPISYVRMTPNKNLTDVEIKVELLVSNPPIQVPLVSSVYNYFEVEKSNITDNDLDNVEVEFKVSKQWLSQNWLIDGTIGLSMYADNKWQFYQGGKLREDAGFVYFKSNAPGLSYFAITSKPLTNVALVSPPAETDFICDPFKEFLGVGDAMVEVYVDDIYIERASLTGGFDIPFDFASGQNRFEVKTKRGIEAVTPKPYTMYKDPVCFGGVPVPYANEELRATQAWHTLQSGVPKTMQINEEGHVVRQLTIESRNEKSNVELKVSVLEAPPQVEKRLGGNAVYEYLEIDKYNLTNDDIKSAEIEFMVQKSWLEARGLAQNEVFLSRYTTTWENLPTTVKSSDATTVTYTAVTPGFSYFAITTAPSAPMLSSVPDSTCNDSVAVNGTAEADVNIYVNDVFATTANSSGNFSVVLNLNSGSNSFDLKAGRGESYSSENTYSITKRACPTGAYSSPAFQTVSKKDGGIPLKNIIKDLKEKEVERKVKYVIETDDEIEPISIVENEVEEPEIRDVYEQLLVEDIESTYEDKDADGVSDTLEVMLGLDIKSPDTDDDGIPDVKEIVFNETRKIGGYDININLFPDSTFDCNDVTLHGEVKGESGEADLSGSILEICFRGSDGSRCVELFPDKDGNFYENFNPGMKPGKYTASLRLNGVPEEEYPVYCTDVPAYRIFLARLNDKDVYDMGNQRKKSFLYTFSPRPYVSGGGPSFGLLFGLWKQGYETDVSILLSDINGYFEASPPESLETFLGFGRAELRVYASDGKTIVAGDMLSFYIFNLWVIVLELILFFAFLMVCRYYLRRILSVFVAALFISFSWQSGALAAENAGYLDTPVQILDISRSEFSIRPDDSKWLTLTLINLTEEDRKLNLAAVDAVNPAKGIYGEVADESRFFSTFVEPVEPFVIKGTSILQLPISVMAPAGLKAGPYYGALLLYDTEDIKDPSNVNLRVLQPMKINVVEPINIRADLSFLYFPIFGFLAMLVIFHFAFHVSFRRRYEVVLLFIAGGAFVFLSLVTYKTPFLSSLINADMEDMIATPDVALFPASDVDESYDYKSEGGESYLQAYGSLADSDDISFLLAALMRKKLIVGTDIYSLTESLLATGEVSATDEVSSGDRAATEDIAATGEVGLAVVGNMVLSIEKLPWLHPDYTGIEVPILRGVHREYKGLEMKISNLLLGENLNKDYVKKYVKKVLSLTDDGEARKIVKSLCYEIREMDLDGKIDYEEIFTDEVLDRLAEDIHKLILTEFPDFKEEDIDEFLSGMLDVDRNREKVLSQAEVICDDFEDAHESVLKIRNQISTDLGAETHVIKLLLNTGGGVPQLITVYTNLDIDDGLLELVADYPATGDVESLIAKIESRHIKAVEKDVAEDEVVHGVAGELQANPDVGAIKSEAESLVSETPVPSEMRQFDLYVDSSIPGLTEDIVYDEDEAKEEKKTEKPVKVEVDLGASKLVEMRIPETIYLSPLSSQSESYVAKSSLGRFELESFDHSKKWEGYFSFEVVKLKDGEQMDKMWMDINGQKIYPVESFENRQKYIHFYISSELFPYVESGQYSFSPSLELLVPEFAIPGIYNAGLYFTMIQ